LLLSVICFFGSGIAGAQEPMEVKKTPSDLKIHTNSLGMELVWIPPGNFRMGSPKNEPDRVTDELLHKVTLSKGFYMSRHLITVEKWKAVMGDSPTTRSLAPKLPLPGLSWDDCQHFIEKLSKKEKIQYRLPTEAEWEYACRAGTTTPYWTGKNISTAQANIAADLESSVQIHGGRGPDRYYERLEVAGSYPPNPFGLYDMHGGIWQWCNDWYGPYPDKDVVDPPGPNRGDARVLRGGCFNRPPQFCRAAQRYSRDPKSAVDSGFRVAFTPVEP
jgi:formylglycine-generating enzyme required for sulfatase activity